MGAIIFNEIEYEPFLIIFRRADAKAHGGAKVDQFAAKYLEEGMYDHLEAFGVSPFNAMAHLDDEVHKEIQRDFNQGASNG